MHSSEPAPSRESSPRSLPPGFYPLRALAALRELIKNPDDTRHVFTIVESLSGRAPLRLLASRAQILPILRDRAALERMPEGSLGHAYLAFVDRERIDADGLVQASVDGETGALVRGADLEYVRDRLRDTHDLWHAVSGYQGDLYGETALLAFSTVQTLNPGLVLIVLTALLRARDPQLYRLVFGGLASGARAEWLPPVEWESLLPLPLEEVRRRLRVAHAPNYAPVRSADLRMTGELAPA